MNLEDNMQLVKEGFESSFQESSFYDRQTVDKSHLTLLLNMLHVQKRETILDLGIGTGYLAFSLAKEHVDSAVIGLDIVTETLKRNNDKAKEENITNLSFISYDGTTFPFSDNSIDSIITRYALHHFPDIKSTFREMYRILKTEGKLIISDPTPNSNDTCHFVDKFMQMKPDGHIKFYHLQEYQDMLENTGFHFISNIASSIRFPRKDVQQYSDFIAETDKDILLGYDISQNKDEIWITEEVLNMLFIK